MKCEENIIILVFIIMVARKVNDHLIRQYFQYSRSNNLSICLVNKNDKIRHGNYGIEKEKSHQCGKELKGSKVSNLKYHIKSKHSNVYEKFLERENKKLIRKTNEKASLSVGQQEKIVSFFTTKRTATISVTREGILRSFLSLVTKDGRPFKCVEDEGVIGLSQVALNALGIIVNRRNIVFLVQAAANEIRKQIFEILKNTLVSVKIDAVTRLNRCFLGLNIQVPINGQIRIFTLVLKELRERHTGKHLCEIILEILGVYGITVNNIYTVTTDGGSNMLKAIEFLDNELKLLREQEDSSECKWFDGDDEIILEEIADDKWWMNGIMAIRCAAHVLQLMVMDTLKNKYEEVHMDRYQELLIKGQDLVKELRRPNNSKNLKEKDIPKPSLDVETRWGSSYLMLGSLLKCKHYCEKYNVGTLSIEEWDQLKELHLSLKPSYIATKKFQDPNLALSDVHKIMDMCHKETAELGTPFSQALVNSYLSRRSTMLKNNVMLSALYLDPRFCFQLTESEKQTAILEIGKTYRRLIDIKKYNIDISLNESRFDTSPTQDDPDLDPAEASYEHSLAVAAAAREQVTSKFNFNLFNEALTAFQFVPRVKSQTPVLQFWEENKNIYPLLYDVAILILAVPGTQVSVERLFSQVHFIFSDKRERLNEFNLDNILLVRTNINNLSTTFYEKTHKFLISNEN